MKKFYTSKYLLIAVLVLITLGVTGCFSEAEFKLTGDTTDKHDQTFRLVTFTPKGVHSEVIATREGHFEYGFDVPKDALPSYVEIYSRDMKLLGVVAVEANKEVQVAVDPRELSRFRAVNADADGPQFNKEFTDWLKKTKKIDDAAIEAFVKSHPTSVVSLALLANLYNAADHPDKAYNLLKGLKTAGRPGYYDNGFLTLMQQYGDATDKLVEAEMLCSADTLFDFKRDKYNRVMIVFTQDNTEERGDSVVPMLGRLAPSAKASRKLVLEHNLSVDTITWKRLLKGNETMLTRKDSVSHRYARATWPSVWTGAGPGAPLAREYAISRLPFFVVADSAGNIVYRGTSASAAQKAYNK